MRKVLPQLGAYQLALVASRSMGFVRDLAIFAVIGATALADQFFFLIGVVDLTMTLMAGNGAVIYLSRRFTEIGGNREYSQMFTSSLLLYLFLALLLLVIEVTLAYPVGQLLFVAFQQDSAIQRAYELVLVGLIFTLPIVGPNAVFLYREKMYVTPLLNVVFTIILLATIFAVYSEITLYRLAMAIIAASIVRFIVALLVAQNLSSGNLLGWPGSVNALFYLRLLSSGVGLGLLVLLPFMFRAELPEFGDGLYAGVAVLFKFVDLYTALLVVPITALILRSAGASPWRRYAILAATVLGVSLIMITVALLLKEHLVSFVPARYWSGQIDIAYDYILVVLLFSSLAICVSLIAVDQQRSGAVLIGSVAAVGVLILFRYLAPADSLPSYFAQLYISYCVFFGFTLGVVLPKWTISFR